jgi:glycerol kinase
MNRFTHVNEIVADGGMTKDVYLMQFQADITGIPVSILSEKENSAFGAAALAALSCGKLGSIGEIAELNKRSKTFEPKMSADEREALLDGWQKAKGKCLA